MDELRKLRLELDTEPPNFCCHFYKKNMQILRDIKKLNHHRHLGLLFSNLCLRQCLH